MWLSNSSVRISLPQKEHLDLLYNRGPPLATSQAASRLLAIANATGPPSKAGPLGLLGASKFLKRPDCREVQQIHFSFLCVTNIYFTHSTALRSVQTRRACPGSPAFHAASTEPQPPLTPRGVVAPYTHQRAAVSPYFSPDVLASQVDSQSPTEEGTAAAGLKTEHREAGSREPPGEDPSRHLDARLHARLSAHSKAEERACRNSLTASPQTAHPAQPKDPPGAGPGPGEWPGLTSGVP